jgi:hypothetical protein
MRLVANSPAARLYDGAFRLENNKFYFYYFLIAYVIDRPLSLASQLLQELAQVAIF